jgi:hypothetical protein
MTIRPASVVNRFAAVWLSGRRRAFVLSLAAACVSLFFAAFAPMASASCGDWLASSVHGMQPSIASSALRDGAADELVPGKKPCDGPMCRQAPDAPAPPVPVSISIRIEKLTIAAAVAVGDPAGRATGHAPESDARPAKGFLPRAFHPPRV